MMHGTHWADRYVELLRERAQTFKLHGDVRGATMAELHAREIEQERQAWEDEEISNEEGAALSGYHPDMLRRLRKEGKWTGKRKDLPRRPRTTPSGPQILDPERAKKSGSIAERVLSRQAGAGSPRASRRRIGES
jgi:hypothetical protein